MWGIKGRFLRPKLNGRCRIRKPPPDGPPPGDRRFFDRRTTGQQPVRGYVFCPAKFEGGVKEFRPKNMFEFNDFWEQSGGVGRLRRRDQIACNPQKCSIPTRKTGHRGAHFWPILRVQGPHFAPVLRVSLEAASGRKDWLSGKQSVCRARPWGRPTDDTMTLYTSAAIGERPRSPRRTGAAARSATEPKAGPLSNASTDLRSGMRCLDEDAQPASGKTARGGRAGRTHPAAA